MTPDSYYPYQPLESESHIRLLKVTKRVDSPSRRGGLRRWSFSLVHVSLNNAPPFETVSYAWGNTARSFSLPVEDAKDIAITKSVFEALPHLIQRSETGLLWLDQICINQDDKDERGHQVSLMGRVFTTSCRTIVWLGLEDRHTDEVKKLLGQVQSLFESRGNVVLEYIRGYHESPDVYPSGPAYEAALDSIIRRPLFSRTWIVQELTLSQSIVMIVGKTKFNWDANFLLLVPVVVRNKSNNTKLSWNRALNLFLHRETSIVYRNENRVWSPLDLLCAINSFHRAEFCATDPKDTIYGYLGLYIPLSFKPSYNITTAQAYMCFTRHMIEDTRSLDILGFCVGVLHSPTTGNIPSWIPHWIIGRAERSNLANHYGDENLWHASKQSLHRSQTVKVTADSTDRLLVRGKVIGSISTLCPPFEFGVLEIVASVQNATEQAGDALALAQADVVRVFIGAKSSGYKRPCSLEHYIRGLETLLEQRNNAFPGQLEEIETHRPYSDPQFALEIKGLCDTPAFKTLGRTAASSLGLFPRLAEPGDSIAVLHGCSVPVLMRKVGEPHTYKVVGGCYVEGIMYGEAFTWDEDKADEITLV